ncbi:MAG: ankyrin repeat domain-containing protein [Desulfobacteraceae bacterium]|nr:ankyrin repeat domain-containing protein [Desulfobacteraceae bacterium]
MSLDPEIYKPQPLENIVYCIYTDENGTDYSENQINSQIKLLKPSNHNSFHRANAHDNNQNSYDSNYNDNNLAKISNLTVEKKPILPEDLKTQLFAAVENNNPNEVKSLLDADANPNAFNEDGETPLIVAVSSEHLDVVGRLLNDPRTNPNAPDKNDEIPLHLAARLGYVDGAKALLSDRRTDPLFRDKSGRTALHVAARSGSVHIINLLLHTKDIVNKQNKYYGQTALHEAAKAGKDGAVHALASDPNIDFKLLDNLHNTALCYAAKRGYVAIANDLLSRKNIKITSHAYNYMDRLIAKSDIGSIRDIVLDGCSKKVYDYLKDKATNTDNQELIERLRHLVPGYSNKEALGGHNKAYAGKGSVPKGILKTVKNYLNSNLPEQQR